MIAGEVRAETTAQPNKGYRRDGAPAQRPRSLMHLRPAITSARTALLRAQGLLLPRCPRRSICGRAPDSKVMVEEMNQRWWSDGLEIACDSGEVP